MRTTWRSCVAAPALLAGALLAGCERPPVETVQRGYRGLGMAQVYNPRTTDGVLQANAVPKAQDPAAAGSPPANTVYKNVTVLGDLNVAEFTRLMVAMTEWVSPEQSCNYCHEGADFASDKPYTKIVARRMLQMTRAINTEWKSHVAGTGVTCYTCHRGKPVPTQISYADPGPPTAKGGMAGNRAGQNTPAAAVGLSALPYDPLTAYLGRNSEVRVVGGVALPSGTGASIQHTEWTYAFMMNISQSLGVNCTYCHNSRSFADWDASTPQRGIAWHGIKMVQGLNANYLDPLKPHYPAARLGPLGDAPKVSCGTCHQGVFKPLMGANMLKDYPELAAAK